MTQKPLYHNQIHATRVIAGGAHATQRVRRTRRRTDRIAKQKKAIRELEDFRIEAVSRLAAQHDEILRLRATLAGHDNVRSLQPAPAPGRTPGAEWPWWRRMERALLTEREAGG